MTEKVFRRIIIVLVFIVIICGWFILNLIPLMIIQYVFFRIIEVNKPIYLGATILTIYNIYRKINRGEIKQYFSDAKWWIN